MPSFEPSDKRAPGTGRSSRDGISLLFAAGAALLGLAGFSTMFLNSSAPSVDTAPPTPPAQQAKDLSDTTTYAPLDTSFPTLAFPRPANENGGMEGAEGAVISGWTPESGGAANAWAASRTA
ncbi:MAG TPA: hypothetical protein PKN23_06150, partial [Candidatus Hydrogenedentes bacterium]|nr:hypothetical protein [Candidatus Hydrogenedentota bacterium]